MQFQDYLANEYKGKQSFDCDICRGKERKCMHETYGTKPIVIEGLNHDAAGARPQIVINTEDDLFDYLRDCMERHPKSFELVHVLAANGSNVCPIPLFDSSVLEIANLVQMTGKIASNYKEYMDAPPVLLLAQRVIESETAKIRAAR